MELRRDQSHSRTRRHHTGLHEREDRGTQPLRQPHPPARQRSHSTRFSAVRGARGTAPATASPSPKMTPPTGQPVYGTLRPLEPVAGSDPRRTHRLRRSISGATLASSNAGASGALSHATELGIQTRMGTQFGVPDRIIMTAICLAVLFSAFSVAVMWRKRRPAGRAGLPRRPVDPRLGRGLIVGAVLLAIVYPLWASASSSSSPSTGSWSARSHASAPPLACIERDVVVASLAALRDDRVELRRADCAGEPLGHGTREGRPRPSPEATPLPMARRSIRRGRVARARRCGRARGRPGSRPVSPRSPR